MKDKIFDIIFYVFIILLVAVGILIIWMIIDFRNDYECSTTNDINWFIEHNCERYFK